MPTKETAANPADGKTYHVEYRGREAEKGENAEKWYRVEGQPEGLTQFEAQAQMAAIQATDETLELRVEAD